MGLLVLAVAAGASSSSHPGSGGSSRRAPLTSPGIMTVAQQKITKFVDQQRSDLVDQEYNIFRTIMATMRKPDETKFGALAKVNVLVNQHYPDRSVADLKKDATLAQKLHQAVIGSPTAVLADVMEEAVTFAPLPDERM